MFNSGNPLDNLSYSERLELSILNQKMSKYVASIDQQRKDLKEAKVPKDNIEDMISHSLRPSDEEMILTSDLWWKAFG